MNDQKSSKRKVLKFGGCKNRINIPELLSITKQAERSSLQKAETSPLSCHSL